jgi:hypothetical protein
MLLSFFDKVTGCNATRPNRPHQNKRKQPAIADRTHTVAKALLTHVAIILTQVSVPAEDGSQQSATFTHCLKGSSPYMPNSSPSWANSTFVPTSMSYS